MIASNYDKIQNHFLIEEVEKLVAMEIVPKAQLDQISQNTVTTKTNSNILIRFAFFLLGNIVLSSIFGVFALLFVAVESQEVFGFLAFLAAIGCVLAAEYFYNQNYFAFGFDDSIILSISLCASVCVGIFTESIPAVVFASLIVTSFCSVRYVHVPSTFFALVSLIGYTGYLVVEEEVIPSSFLPILLFVIAVGLYFFQNQISKNAAYFLYKNVLETIKIFSLVLGYASLNYFVVRELSEILLGFYFEPNREIPLGSLFYFATFAIPVLYIYLGLKQKDRTFFWIGLLSLALGFATIRYYYSILPIEIALLLGGTVLFVITYFSIRTIRDKTTGITFNEDKNLNPMAFEIVKNILVNANMHATITTNQESPMEFGGGGFSGGGSGGNF